MKNRKLIQSIVFAGFASTMMLTGCDGDSLKVKGHIEGASDKMMAIERADFNGGWTTLDSIRINGSGDFSAKVVAPASPEIYRLAFDGSYIYFPVVGKETITIDSKADSFAASYTLAGTTAAETMARFDKEANALPSVSELDSVERFKRKLFAEVFQNGNGDILSYYFITKQIGNNLLFDPTNKSDARYIGAVATAFQQHNADDPHAKLLEAMGLAAMRQHTAGKTVEAQEINFFDITLPNTKGEEVSLSSVAGNGKPTILAFMLLTMEGAPEINKYLSDVYTSGRANVYEVCFDSDAHLWSQAAVNLPWSVVYEQAGTGSKTLSQYNVSEIPTFFLINAEGELVKRADSLEELF